MKEGDLYKGFLLFMALIIFYKEASIMNNIDKLKEIIELNDNIQIVDKTTKISMNILMFWSFFKKNKPYD